MPPSQVASVDVIDDLPELFNKLEHLVSPAPFLPFACEVVSSLGVRLPQSPASSLAPRNGPALPLFTPPIYKVISSGDVLVEILSC